MGRSPGFGSALRDFPPFSDLVSLRMSASSPFSLPRVATRRTVLQKVRGCTSSCGAPAGRRHRVSGSLSLPSRGTFHLSLTVLFAIGHRVVFSLGGWSPRLPLLARLAYPYGAFTLSGRLSQNRSGSLALLFAVHNPRKHAPWFRLFRFRSPLLTESMFLSLPLGT